MNPEHTLLSLTRVAFLNAMVLSLLGIQFLIPPSFMVMLLLVPMIFSLQMYISSFRHVFLSCVFLLVLTLSLYGIGIFSWTIFYSLVGIAGGFTMKKGFSKALRVFMIAFAYITSFALFVMGLGALIGLKWDEIMVEYHVITQRTNLNFMIILSLGIIIWGLILSFCVDWLVLRILKQVDI